MENFFWFNKSLGIWSVKISEFLLISEEQEERVDEIKEWYPLNSVPLVWNVNTWEMDESNPNKELKD